MLTNRNYFSFPFGGGAVGGGGHFLPQIRPVDIGLIQANLNCCIWETRTRVVRPYKKTPERYTIVQYWTNYESR
jgi:hypothetical protein